MRRRIRMIALLGTIGLGACQTAALPGGSDARDGQTITLGAKQIPLPTGGPWRMAAERTYATDRGTAMTDTVLVRTEGDRVRAIVWGTTNVTSQRHASGWQLAAFCRRGDSDSTRLLVDNPGALQDCWTIEPADPIFTNSDNPSVRALDRYLSGAGLTLDATLATVSFHYANGTDILQVTYGFAPDGAGGSDRPPMPRTRELAALRQWTEGFHVKVRLGFHDLLGRDSMPVTFAGETFLAATFSNGLRPPDSEGVATPQPQTPLAAIGGFIGDIPPNDTASIDLVTANFERLVFQTEYGGPYPWLQKWSRAPVLKISTRFDATAKATIRQTADRLRALTGLDFTVTDADAALPEDVASDAAQGAVVFLASSGGLGAASCYGRFRTVLDGSLAASVIFVGPGIPGYEVNECIIEEFAQVLGPINDTTFVVQSIFNDQTNGIVSDLTWHDAVILRTLYDERLKPGMPKARAMPIARQIIAELLAELN